MWHKYEHKTNDHHRKHTLSTRPGSKVLMTGAPEAALEDLLGDLVGGLLGDLPRPWIRAGPRSDPGELQSVVCILQSRTALVCLAWLVMCVAAARITPHLYLTSFVSEERDQRTDRIIIDDACVRGNS